VNSVSAASRKEFVNLRLPIMGLAGDAEPEGVGMKA
jgi:hypothetical protein